MAYFVMVRDHDSVRDFVPFSTVRPWSLGRIDIETFYGPYTLAGALRVQRRAVGSVDVHTMHGAQPADGTVALWAADAHGGTYAEVRTYAPYGAHRDMPRD